MEDNQAKSEMTQLVEALHAHTDSVLHKHVQVTYGLIVLVLAIVLSAGFIIHSEMKSFTKSWDKAAATETAYRADLAKAQAQIASDQAQIAALNTRQTTVVKIVHDRDTTAQKDQQTVLQPKPITAVAADAQRVLGIQPEQTPDDKLAFAPPDVQGLVSMKLDRDRLVLDLTDTQSLYQLEQQKDSLLTTNNGLLTASLKECNGSLEQYKHVAKKSKFHRILGALKTAGEIGFAAVVGVEIGKVLK